MWFRTEKSCPLGFALDLVKGVCVDQKVVEPPCVNSPAATTEESTTEESTTTKKPTTEKSTTEKSTTEKSTTEKPTTEKPTTEPQTSESVSVASPKFTETDMFQYLMVSGICLLVLLLLVIAVVCFVYFFKRESHSTPASPPAAPLSVREKKKKKDPVLQPDKKKKDPVFQPEKKKKKDKKAGKLKQQKLDYSWLSFGVPPPAEKKKRLPKAKSQEMKLNPTLDPLHMFYSMDYIPGTSLSTREKQAKTKMSMNHQDSKWLSRRPQAQKSSDAIGNDAAPRQKHMPLSISPPDPFRTIDNRPKRKPRTSPSDIMEHYGRYV